MYCKVSGANTVAALPPGGVAMPHLPSVSSLLASCARILGDVLERDQSRPINRAIAFYTRILLIRAKQFKICPTPPNVIAIDSG